MMKLLLSLVAVLVSVVPASAQQTIVSYTLDVTLTGAASPMQSNAIPASAVQCNQPPVSAPTGTVYNPRQASWDDSANAGRSCIVDQSTFLLGLPVSTLTYTATVTGMDSIGLPVARSAASNPFGRANPLPARTGVKITP